MRDAGAFRHAMKDRADPRVNKYSFCEKNKGVMHIMLWYGSCYAVQISRSHAQRALSRMKLDVACMAES